MIREFPKPDGVVELGQSACCCPPGQRHNGQHTNACTSWWRVTGKPWVKARSVSSLLVPAEAAESCADFEQYMIDIYLK